MSYDVGGQVHTGNLSGVWVPPLKSSRGKKISDRPLINNEGGFLKDLFLNLLGAVVYFFGQSADEELQRIDAERSYYEVEFYRKCNEARASFPTVVSFVLSGPAIFFVYWFIVDTYHLWYAITH